MKQPEWIVLSRPECGLCEEFLLELHQLVSQQQPPIDIRVADVDSDPAWVKKYGDRIPVLLVDDDYVCAIRLDHNRVRRLLSSPL